MNNLACFVTYKYSKAAVHKLLGPPPKTLSSGLSQTWSHQVPTPQDRCSTECIKTSLNSIVLYRSTYMTLPGIWKNTATHLKWFETHFWVAAQWFVDGPALRSLNHNPIYSLPYSMARLRLGSQLLILLII